MLNRLNPPPSSLRRCYVSYQLYGLAWPAKQVDPADQPGKTEFSIDRLGNQFHCHHFPGMKGLASNSNFILQSLLKPFQKYTPEPK